MMKLENLLHKYLNGNATIEDIARLKADPHYKTFVRISETASNLQTPYFQDANTFESIQKKRLNSTKVKKLNPLAVILKLVALIAILAAGYIFISSLDTTITTEIAQKEFLTLPDASEVIVNANSKVTYNRKDWKTKRIVALSGEAYFDVKKGSSFRVETNQGTVTVLGTQFNVLARDTIFNVACYEGLVSVRFKDQTLELPAGNMLKIENNKLVLNAQSPHRIPYWIASESSFENDALSTVLNELRAQYPITITAPNHINAKRFTGSFTHTNLEHALRAVCAPLQLEFTIDGDQVRIYALGEK